MDAIAATVLESDHLEQYLDHECGERYDVETHWALGVDATLTVIFSSMKTGVVDGSFEKIMDTWDTVLTAFHFRTRPQVLPMVPMGSCPTLLLETTAWEHASGCVCPPMERTRRTARS